MRQIGILRTFLAHLGERQRCGECRDDHRDAARQTVAVRGRMMRVVQSLLGGFDRFAHPSTLVSAVLSGAASASRIFVASRLRLNGLAMKCTPWSSTPLCRMAFCV